MSYFSQSGLLVTSNNSIASTGKNKENIQWGSEYLASQDFKWSKTVWLSNGPDFKRQLNTRPDF